MILKWNKIDEDIIKELSKEMYNNIKNLEIIKMFNKINKEDERFPGNDEEEVNLWNY